MNTLTVEQLCDLAFNYVQITNREDLYNSISVKDFMSTNNMDLKYVEFFLVFVKHWVHNKLSLEFADCYMDFQ